MHSKQFWNHFATHCACALCIAVPTSLLSAFEWQLPPAESLPATTSQPANNPPTLTWESTAQRAASSTEQTNVSSPARSDAREMAPQARIVRSASVQNVAQDSVAHSGAVQPASYTTSTSVAIPTEANASRSSAFSAVPEKRLAIQPPKNVSTNKPSGTQSGVWQSLITTFFALLLVIGIFATFVLIMRRKWQGTTSNLPKEVFQVMGRSSYGPRQQVLVAKFGHKILLISHELGNVQTLSEIDSPEEVDRISGLCEQNMTHSVTNSFRQVFSQVMRGEPVVRRGSRPVIVSKRVVAAHREPV